MHMKLTESCAKFDLLGDRHGLVTNNHHSSVSHEVKKFLNGIVTHAQELDSLQFGPDVSCEMRLFDRCRCNHDVPPAR